MDPRRRPVRVDDVDLSDGETLQMSGWCAASIVDGLRLVAECSGVRIEGVAEMLSADGRHRAFHVWLDLAPLLDATDGDIRAHLETRRGRCRVDWSTDAFAQPNHEIIRAVAPDPGRGLQCSITPPDDSGDVVVRRAPLEPRPSLRWIDLDTGCAVAVMDQLLIERVGWSDGDAVVWSERQADGWRWPDLAPLARPGARWSLIVVGRDDRRRQVHFPWSDLRHPAAARVFPYATIVTDGRTVRLAAGAGRRQGVVLRCREADTDGSS